MPAGSKAGGGLKTKKGYGKKGKKKKRKKQ